MALETAEYVTELRRRNPTRDDPISDGDNHIRMIKDVLKNTFPEADCPQAKVVNPELEEGSIITNNAGRWREMNNVKITPGGDIDCHLNASGNVVSQSDERLKTKHSNVNDALDKVKMLDTFTYLPNSAAWSVGCPTSSRLAYLPSRFRLCSLRRYSKATTAIWLWTTHACACSCWRL